VYALLSISATEIDRLMREATRKRSTSISSERIDGKAAICCSVLVCWLAVRKHFEDGSWKATQNKALQSLKLTHNCSCFVNFLMMIYS